MKISRKYQVPASKLDFVNINLDKDNMLFIDPLRIKRGKTEFHNECNKEIESFVNHLLTLSKNKKYTELLNHIDHFYERNETHLGYSINNIFGKSFGQNGGTSLVQAFSKNDMLQSGAVEDIFDFLIMVPNIGEDKVSDIITTIIFLNLVRYTQKQCKLWNIPMKKVRISKECWNPQTKKWEKRKEELPIHEEKPIVFIPKSFTGKKYIFSYEQFYRDIIIPVYKREELKEKESKFVVEYKNGKRHVLGNELRKKYPCTKYVVIDFVKKYDLEYREYKNKILSGKRVVRKILI